MNPMRQKLISHITGLLDPTRVTINRQAIEAVQADFSGFSPADARLPFAAEKPEDTIPYLLAQTALQYRFWDGSGENYRRYTLDSKVGSVAMVMGFDIAWGTGPLPGTDMLACANLPFATTNAKAQDVLKRHFGDIPDPASRIAILSEVLTVTRLARVVTALDEALRAGRAGVEEALLISKEFPLAYGDPFIKKSQLAITLMAAEYRRAGFSVTPDVFAFADYQVPAVMRHFGILEYSDKLAAKVDSRQLLKKGGPDELAIRAATIIGCEMFAEHHGVTAAETDWFFWLKRKEPVRPFHLTMTTAY